MAVCALRSYNKNGVTWVVSRVFPPKAGHSRRSFVSNVGIHFRETLGSSMTYFDGDPLFTRRSVFLFGSPGIVPLRDDARRGPVGHFRSDRSKMRGLLQPKKGRVTVTPPGIPVTPPFLRVTTYPEPSPSFAADTDSATSYGRRSYGHRIVRKNRF